MGAGSASPEVRLWLVEGLVLSKHADFSLVAKKIPNHQNPKMKPFLKPPPENLLVCC